jgi:ech hydrogenase subunit D
MSDKQKIINIEAGRLLAEVNRFKDEGRRLVQICCTRLEALEMNYSFDKDYTLITLRLVLSLDNPRLPSISGVYWSAFIYENELQDLFGIEVEDMAVDYKGRFYRTKVKWPYRQEK